MANVTSVQILQDGPRNCILKFQGTLDTADLSLVTVVDPATLSEMTTGVVPVHLRIEEVQFVVQDGLVITLFWDATTPVQIETFAGRDEAEYCDFGGLVSNAGAGDTGKIVASSTGVAPGSAKSFSLVMTLIKTA